MQRRYAGCSDLHIFFCVDFRIPAALRQGAAMGYNTAGKNSRGVPQLLFCDVKFQKRQAAGQFCGSREKTWLQNFI
jgi:hypothetical protein